jgi:hypothetical protein
MNDGRVDDVWGDRTPYGAGEAWPERGDIELDDGVGPEDEER